MAIYKCGQGFLLGATVKQIQVAVRAGLKPGTAMSDMMTTRPSCLRLLLGHCTRIVVNKTVIAGFHMTSLNFKLQKY